MAALLPLVAVIASLVALVVVFVQVERRTRQLREEVTQVAEPARALLNDLQRIYALQISAKRGFLLTGDTDLLEQYRELRVEEQRVYDQLRPLVAQMEPEVQEPLDTLLTRAPLWHATFPDPAVLGDSLSAAARVQRLPMQQQLYVSTLAALGRLDTSVAMRARAAREQVRAIERNERRLGLVLVLLALAGAAAVFQVARRMRALSEASRGYAAEAERLMEQRASFIRGITHDLKNPLGAVDAYAQILEQGIKGDLTPDQQAIIVRIRRATQETLTIIEDLLALSRAETGELRVERRATDVGKLIAEAAEDYRASVETAGLTLAVHVPDDLPPVRLDASRVRQILGNLLSNAVKYTREGEVVVRAAEFSGNGSPGSGQWIRVDVSDTGLGIPAEEQDRVFEEFHRIHRDHARGVGLGLAISRRIARLLGGDVTLASEVGRGSTFTLWLPLSPAERPPVNGQATPRA